VYVDNLVTRRQIQALFCLGYRSADIGDLCGWSRAMVAQLVLRPRIRATSADRIATLYARLIALPAPTGPAADRQRHQAAWRRLAPPWAWDGALFRMDDPQADPAAAVATFGLAPPLRRLAMLDHAHTAAELEHPQRVRELRLAYFRTRRQERPATYAEAS
jgi:hypothetical protein